VTGLKSFILDVMHQQRISLDALPLGSANTLNCLDVGCNVEETFTLEAFTNLDTLRWAMPTYNDVRDNFFDLLAPCPSRLRRLDTTFGLRSEENVSSWTEYQSSIFILPCLQQLKELELWIQPAREGTDRNFRKSDKFVGLCMDSLQALAASLVNLENLTISAGLDVLRVEPLGNLKMLKKLIWSVNAAALRGVAIGSDLNQCVPLWFQEFVENAVVFIQFGWTKYLQMRGKMVLNISDPGDTIFRGDDEMD